MLCCVKPSQLALCVVGCIVLFTLDVLLLLRVVLRCVGPQAMDRCHRIGQEKPVLVFRLATSHR